MDSNVKENELLDMAYELGQEGHYTEAINCYNKIIKKNPCNIYALIDKGVTLQIMNRPKRALECFDKALKQSPKNTTALVGKGAVLHELKRYKEAVTCYDKVLKLDGKSPIALAYKGLSLGEMGKLKDAKQCFHQALKIDKDYDIPNDAMKTIDDLIKQKQKSNTKNKEIVKD